MLDGEELMAALQLGHELRGFELKGPGLPGDKVFLAKIARAMLGMGNLRDGGHVIVGIDEKWDGFGPGLTQEALTGWLDFDDLSRKLAGYADPPLEFDVAPVRVAEQVTVAVIEVSEFADVPHVCTRDAQPTLRAGALYVRPRRVPETSELASTVEMREILEMATEKALRSLVRQLSRAGLPIETLTLESESSRSALLYKAELTEAGL